MRITLLTAILICAFGGYSDLVAQNVPSNDSLWLRSQLGLMGGMQYNTHSADFSSLPGIPNCCPQFEAGYGSGFYGGLFYRLPFSVALSVAIGLAYTDHSADLVYRERELLRVGNESYLGTIEHLVEASIAAIGIESLLRYRLTAGFFVKAGFLLGAMVHHDFYQKEEIIDPPDRGMFLLEQSRIRNELAGEIEGTSTLQFNLLAGLGYAFFVDESQSFSFEPELLYSLGLTDALQDDEWKMNGWHAGVRLGYRIPESKPALILPPLPPPPSPPPPRTPILTAEVSAMALYAPDSLEELDHIQIEEFVSTKMYPVLNHIFFDEMSAVLPSRYHQLHQRDTKDFTYANLRGKDMMSTYKDVLNVLGKRLSELSREGITLVGTNADVGRERGDTELSRKRAMAVKDYLTRVWGIDPVRIKVQARNLPAKASSKEDPLGCEENRRVELRSSKYEILEPLVLNDTVKLVTPQTIRFLPAMQAEAGLVSWKLSVRQGGRTLEEFSGKGAIQNPFDLRIDKQGVLDKDSMQPITYQLQVRDTHGNTTHSEEYRLDVHSITVKKKRSEQLADKEIDYYNLILFDFGSLELDDENRRIVERIREHIGPESVVRITGHTDRIGDEAFNRKLSEGRARSTARALGVSTRNARGVGESELLFDNSTPEGRFHCRTVVVTVETPIMP